MSRNKSICDCELCLFKTFPLDNPLVNDADKIVEAIIYHFIFRLGSLVKSPKELNSRVIRFITIINNSYILSNDMIKNINLIYKKLMGSGTCCKYSNNVPLNKLIKKEATYLKTIIGSMQEYEEEEPSFITVLAPSIAPIPTSLVPTSLVPTSLVPTSLVPTIVIEDTNGDIVDLSDEIVPANPEPVSYLSYCVVS
jgi:hypothetical protein